MSKECLWKLRSDNVFESSCGFNLYFNNQGSRLKDGFVFCPSCGGDVCTKTEEDIPLNFDWDCLPGWATGEVKYDPSPHWMFCYDDEDDNEGFDYIPIKFEPKPPFPPGYEDGRVFERPKECDHDWWIEDDGTYFCKHCKVERPPEATEDKTCEWTVNPSGKRFYFGCSPWNSVKGDRFVLDNCPECHCKIVKNIMDENEVRVCVWVKDGIRGYRTGCKTQSKEKPDDSLCICGGKIVDVTSKEPNA